MNEKIYRDDDVDLGVLQGKTLAVLGFGIQGRAQAANARDSGCTVIVGVRPASQSASRRDAEKEGFPVLDYGEATAAADVILVELADPAQPSAYRDHIAPNLRSGQTLVFCHGFNVLYGAITPPRDINTVLFVPNAPGAFVREKYLQGEGIYGCVSVDHDATGDALEIALAVSKAVGSTRAGVVNLTFQQETEGDNFEEQILYGGVIHLMRLCFQTMVDNGYPPSFAYAKSIRSLRSVIDVMDEHGIEDYLTGRSSRTCEFAVRTRGPRVINDEAVRQIFDETQRGIFARDWMQEWSLGMPQVHRLRRTAAESEMERTGREWRTEFGV
ncbi:MAG: ketol-acid reductoisomerase [Spirochaetaceae bacterium]|nr:MAG: ketol-acid reductoisomerase [Spirochaetaceae bacterium]